MNGHEVGTQRWRSMAERRTYRSQGPASAWQCVVEVFLSLRHKFGKTEEEIRAMFGPDPWAAPA